MDQALPNPGWYPDPEEPNKLRYWDGQAWTGHRADASATKPEKPPRGDAAELQPTGTDGRFKGFVRSRPVLSTVLATVVAPRGKRLTYANVVSTLALFLVLGGGAAWATHEVIDSSDIVDNSVSSADLKNNVAVRSADVRDDTATGGGLGSQDIGPGAIGDSEVADDALTGADIGDETLTGADIFDEGLTTVDVLNDSLNGKDISELSGDDVDDNTLTGADIANTASGADAVNADRVDGRHVCRGEASAGSSFTTICASGELTIEASCTPISSASASGVARLRTSQSSNAFYVINGSSNATDANFTAGDGPATLVSLAGGPAGAVTPTITRFHASSETGQLTGSIAARVFAFSSSTASCEFTMDILG